MATPRATCVAVGPPRDPWLPKMLTLPGWLALTVPTGPIEPLVENAGVVLPKKTELAKTLVKLLMISAFLMLAGLAFGHVAQVSSGSFPF